MNFIMKHPQSSVSVIEFDLTKRGSVSCIVLDCSKDERARQAKSNKTIISAEEGVSKLAAYLAWHPRLLRRILVMWLKKTTSPFGIQA